MGCDAQRASGENCAQGMNGENCLGKFLRGVSGRMSGMAMSWVNIQIPMQDYKSLRIAAMICSNLVNTQTHSQLLAGLYTISSASRPENLQSLLRTGHHKNAAETLRM